MYYLYCTVRIKYRFTRTNNKITVTKCFLGVKQKLFALSGYSDELVLSDLCAAWPEQCIEYPRKNHESPREIQVNYSPTVADGKTFVLVFASCE